MDIKQYNENANILFSFKNIKRYDIKYTMSDDNLKYVLLTDTDKKTTTKLMCQYKIMLFASTKNNEIIICGKDTELKYKTISFEDELINKIIRKNIAKHIEKNVAIEKLCVKIFNKIYKFLGDKIQGIIFDEDPYRIVCIVITNIVRQ